MHAREHEFTRPVSPQLPFLTSSSSCGNVHVQTHYDESVPANKIIHVTNYNHESSCESVPEDSCDSFMDTDTDDASFPGISQGDTEQYQSLHNALNKAVNSKLDSSEPYHRYVTPGDDDLSPQIELKKLIKEVETPQTSSPENPSHYKDDAVIDKLLSDTPEIIIVEEPETTYRARYESEGCKGPIHGATETGFPTIKIKGYIGEVVITVFVVTREDEPHLHTATGPGSTKAQCEEVKLEDGTPAIQMLLKPEDENDEMIAIFDQLSIRRVRNWEADRELRKRGIEPATWKSKKKEAKLAFQASIPASKNHDAYLLTTYSRLFLCTAPSGNPEIWWASLSECPAEGAVEMGFIGKKFASGFKVRFFSKEDYGNTWEAYGEVDKAKTNLNACVIKVPPYKETVLTENVVVYVEIRVGPEKESRNSDPYSFTYTASKNVEGCANCTQIKGFLQRIFSGQSNEMPLASLNVETKQEIPKREMNNNLKMDLDILATNNAQLHSPVKSANNVAASPHATFSNDIQVLLQQSKIVNNIVTPTIAAPSEIGVLYIPKMGELNGVIPVISPKFPPNCTHQVVALQQSLHNKQVQNITTPTGIHSQIINNGAANFLGTQQHQMNNTLLSVLPKAVLPVATQSVLSPAPTVHIANGVGLTGSSYMTYQHAATQPVPMLVASGQRSVAVELNPTSCISSYNPIVNPCTAPLAMSLTNSIQQTYEKVKEERTSPNYVQEKHVLNKPIILSNHNPQRVFSRNENNQVFCPPVISTSNLYHDKDSSSLTTSFSRLTSVESNTLPTDTLPTDTLPLEKEIQLFTRHVENLKNILKQQESNFLQSDVLRNANHNQSPAVQLQPNTDSVHQNVDQLQQGTNQLQHNASQHQQKSGEFQQNPGQSQQNTNQFQQNAVQFQHNAGQLQLNQQQQTQSTIYQHGNKDQQQVQYTSPNYQLVQRAATGKHLMSPVTNSFEQDVNTGQIFMTTSEPAQMPPATYNSVEQKQMMQQAGSQIRSPVYQQASAVYHTTASVEQQALPFATSSYSDTNSQQATIATYQANETTYTNQQEKATVYCQQHHVQPQLTLPSFTSQQQQSSFPLPQQLYQQSAQPRLRYSSTFQSQQIFDGMKNLNDFSRTNFETQVNSEAQWEHRPSINDAIATNKIGYCEISSATKISSRPVSPTKLEDNDENNFLTTLQQLNNSHIYSSLPSTPMANQLNINSSPGDMQHLSQMDTSVVDANDLSQSSEVSVDYSDAYKNMNKQTSHSWTPYQDNPTQFGPVQQTLYQQQEQQQSTNEGVKNGW